MKKLLYLFLTLLIVGCSTDDDNSTDLQKEWLYTHTSLDATATNSTTIVIPLTGDIFAFTDRPNREYKYINGDEFASYWNDYDDGNSFKLDPPNAVLTWVDADGVSEVEVVITDANFDGNNVIYTIENTTITANQSFEDVSLFVDGNGSGNNVYLASNGITVKASAGAEVGSEGVLNGVGYVIVDLTILNGMIAAQDDITTVVTSKITDMNGMFFYSSYNQDISSWDVSNVTDMTSMFEGSSFNGDISSWDVSSVTDMSGMFSGSGDFNQDISSWDVSNVTSMNQMFFGASAFNQDIGTWNVSNVNAMREMFREAEAFNKDISSWDVGNVLFMTDMFHKSYSFNQDISTWDVSNVTDMNQMFIFAAAYNQDLSGWDVENVTNCFGFSLVTPEWQLPKPNFTNCDPN
jgi:surface protein